MPKEVTMDDVVDSTIDEIKSKAPKDDEFALAVAKGISTNEKALEAMLDDTGLTAKLAEQLLKKDDGDFLRRVKGELALDGLHLESGGSEKEYGRKEALRDFEILAKAAKHREDPESVAKACGVEVSKTMQETDFSNAGVLIDEPILDEIIPILTASSVFMDSGAVLVNMEATNKVGIGRQNQDPETLFEDENATMTESDLDFDKLQLNGKKLTTLASISNDFLRRDAIITGDAFLAERMMVSMKNKIEQTIFRGTGGQYQWEGITLQVDSAHVNASSGNSVTNISDDFKEARQLLEGEDVPDNDRRYFMRKDVLVDFVFDISSTEDSFPFREEIVENGTMHGDGVEATNNIELDGNDSNIYYVEMSEQYIGRGTDFTLDSSEHERFTSDETLLKMIAHFDYKMKHDKSAAVIEDYTLQTA